MSSQMSLPARGYNNLIYHGSNLQSVFLLIARLAWGWESAQSGWAHLHNIEKQADFFRSLNIPMPVMNVYISGTTELVGGSLLLIGFATRLVAIPFMFNFIVAIVTASGADIIKKYHESADSGGFLSGLLDGWTKIVDDTAFPFALLGLGMIAFGAGRASIDYLLARTAFGRTHRSTATSER